MDWREEGDGEKATKISQFVGCVMSLQVHFASLSSDHLLLPDYMNTLYAGPHRSLS